MDLKKNGPYYLIGVLLSAASKLVDSIPVYAWPNATNPDAFLANDNLPSIITHHHAGSPTEVTAKKSWLSGLNLQGVQGRNLTNTGSAHETHLQLIKQSMISALLFSIDIIYCCREPCAENGFTKKTGADYIW